jgi:hypothetical protein
VVLREILGAQDLTHRRLDSEDEEWMSMCVMI